MDRLKADIYIGLIHHPIYNKRGDKITTTVTNLDLHDIARAGKTYAVNKYYVINPLKSQQVLVKRMQEYWRSEFGAKYNLNRKQAFSLLEIAPSLDNVLDLIKEDTKKEPILIATDARVFPNSVSYKKLRQVIFTSDRPFLLLFGTGWGLTEETLDRCDYMLDPIFGRGEFNHLSVRSAVSIILDRVLAENWWE